MFRSLDDFSAAWAHESEGTLKVMRNLSDASLSQRVVADGRSHGFLAWHITCSLTEMASRSCAPVPGNETSAVSPSGVVICT